MITKKDKNTMLNTTQKEFVDYAVNKYGTNELTVAQLKEANQNFGHKYAPQWLIKNKDYKIGKGLFQVPTETGETTAKTSGASEKVLSSKI